MKNYLNTTTYNISWFKKASDAGELEMSPPFQRNPVWTDRQKSFLIDSILNGYPIPEIYIQEKISADGKTKYVIVDGQQRIRAVLGFIAGDYEISEDESTKWATFSFEDLSEEDDNTNIVLYASGIRNSSDLNARKNRYSALKSELGF